MGKIIATTGAELMSGDTYNIMSDYEGTAMLAPIYNLVPDPDFGDYIQTTAELRYWLLQFPPTPDGWMSFVKDNATQRQYSRQSTGPLSTLKQDIKDELVPGASPLDANETIDIAAPMPPRVQAYRVSKTIGFPAGWYCIAYGWILGGGGKGKKNKKNHKNSKRTTGPGPRSDAFEVAQGQGLLVVAPTEVPEDVIGVEYFLTSPEKTENQALMAPLFSQEKFSSASHPKVFRMTGPFNKKDKWNGKNTTYIGGKAEDGGGGRGKVRHRTEKAGGKRTTSRDNRGSKKKQNSHNSKVKDDFKLGYRAVSEKGVSDHLGKGNPRMKGSHTGNGDGVFKFRPADLHEDARGWKPLVTSRDSKTGAENTYQINKNKGGNDFFEPDEEAPMYSGNPGEVPGDSGTTMTPDEGAMEDQTGVSEPTDSPEIPQRIDLNTSGLTPGSHWVKAAMFVGEDGEGPVSGPRKVRIQAGEGLRISAPRWFNKLDNPDIAESEANEDGTLDDPVHWKLHNESPDVTVKSPMVNVLDVDDLTDTETDETLFETPSAELDDPNIDRYTVGFRFKFKQKEHGIIAVYMHEYDENNALLGSRLVETLGANVKRRLVGRQYFLSRREEDDEAPLLMKLRHTTGLVTFSAISRGTGKQKKRNFRAQFSDFAVVPGWAIPDPTDPGDIVTDPGVDPELQDPEEYKKYIRPLGGYCVVVRNPDDGPIRLNADIKDWTVFQSGTYEGWTPNATSPPMNNALATGAAIVSRYGVHMHKTVAATHDSTRNYIYKDFTPARRMTVGCDYFLSNFDASGMDLSAIIDTGNNTLAMTSLTGVGDLVLNVGGIQHFIASGFDDAQMLSVELHVDLDLERVEVRYGPDEDNLGEPFVFEDVEFSGVSNVYRVAVGASIDGIPKSAIFSLKLGRIMVSDYSISSRYNPIPGNYIEYFGPYGTPVNEKYGPTGLRVPAKPFQDYNISSFAWSQGMAPGSTALRVRAVDKNGVVLRVYNPVITDLGGDRKYWQRYQNAIVTPSGTDHLEFFSNNLGAGRLKIFGLQVSEGAIMRAYSNLRQRKGHMRVYLSNRQGELQPGDPMWELGRIKKLRRVLVAGADSPVVSYFSKYRTANTFDALDMLPYELDWSKLPLDKDITEVRIDMSSMEDGATPEIRSIELDVQRKHSQLCREDGTEYQGGCIAYEITTPSEPPHYENIDLATGARIADEWGTERIRTIKFKVDVFRKSAAEEIMYSLYHILETPTSRYTIIAEDGIEFSPEPGTRVYFNDGREFFQRETADVTAWIVSEEKL